MMHAANNPLPATICLLLLMVILAPMASAENIWVDRFDDSSTATACDGFTANDCSLRGAIIRANGNGEDDTVWIAMEGTYLLTRGGTGDSNGDLDITDDLVIIGWDRETVIIDASGLPNSGDRVFHVQGGVVSFRNIQITGGLGTPAAGTGGGIYNSGNLTLDRCDINGNSATYWGGAIFNDHIGTLKLGLTEIYDNDAGDSGGCIHNEGVLEMTDSTLGSCIAGAEGGGLANESTGTATLRRSTIGGCHAGSSSYAPLGGLGGGGIYNRGYLTVVNCTFAENSALSSGGGAIFNEGDITLRNDTLVFNASPLGSAIQNIGDGEVVLGNSIIGGTCSGSTSGFDSLGGNIESPGQSCNLIHASDQGGVSDVLFDRFDHHGGNTVTLSLQPASPAVDACHAATPAKDQRGVARPIDGDGDGTARCDSGAYEYDPAELFRDGFESGSTGEWAPVP